jgi:hypothetical protein
MQHQRSQRSNLRDTERVSAFDRLAAINAHSMRRAGRSVVRIAVEADTSTSRVRQFLAEQQSGAAD